MCPKLCLISLRTKKKGLRLNPVKKKEKDFGLTHLTNPNMDSP